MGPEYRIMLAALNELRNNSREKPMPYFSPQSLVNLETCHPDLKTLFKTVILTQDCTIICGYRNEADQNKAYAQGKTKLRWPLSKHNQSPSLAVDVLSSPIDWSNWKQNYYFAGYVQSVADKLFAEGKMTHRLRWGGNFSQAEQVGVVKEPFTDIPHWELIT